MNILRWLFGTPEERMKAHSESEALKQYRQNGYVSGNLRSHLPQSIQESIASNEKYAETQRRFRTSGSRGGPGSRK